MRRRITLSRIPQAKARQGLDVYVVGLFWSWLRVKVMTRNGSIKRCALY